MLRLVGSFFSKGTTWDYDPMPILRRVSAPILWQLAAEDQSAPVSETRRRLLKLHGEGRPITVLEFPATDHGIQEFIVQNGERKKTRYAEVFFEAQLEFAPEGRLAEREDGTGRRLTP